MTDTACFLDANVVAAPVTRTLFVAGAREDGLIVQWSAQVEEEADRHSRAGATLPSDVRRTMLSTELSPSALGTAGLVTKSLADRQILADAILAEAKYLITIDVDDFAIEDLKSNWDERSEPRLLHGPAIQRVGVSSRRLSAFDRYVASTPKQK